jgi:THO complex subunit 2
LLITAKFRVYTSFWLLSASDIHVNVDLYNREIERVRKERDDLPKADMSKTRRAREDERLKTLEQKLSQELSRQQEHVKRVEALVTEKKEFYFAKTGTSKDLQNLKFIQYCLLPRCTFSEADAVYCAKFIHLLHSFRTGYFNTLVVFDKVTY